MKIGKAKLSKDQGNLDAVLAIVREHCPHAVAIQLETSDQGLYGFVLREVTEESPSTGLYFQRDPEDALPADAQDKVTDLLSDLDWDGVVGESPQGYARVEVSHA